MIRDKDGRRFTAKTGRNNGHHEKRLKTGLGNFNYKAQQDKGPCTVTIMLWAFRKEAGLRSGTLGDRADLVEVALGGVGQAHKVTICGQSDRKAQEHLSPVIFPREDIRAVCLPSSPPLRPSYLKFPSHVKGRRGSSSRPTSTHDNTRSQWRLATGQGATV